MTRRLTCTVTEVAETLGVSKGLVYQMVQRGEIASIRLGRRVVVPQRALDALLEASAS